MFEPYNPITLNSITQLEELLKYRAIELKHGRVAMLAVS